MDYYYIDGAQIFNSIKKDEDIFVSKIATNTVNTWQPNRDKSETLANTAQGKIAENGFEYYVKEYAGFSYISYDKIRKDEFRKHAPFDGILFKKSNTEYQSLITDIINDVDCDDYGRLTTLTRKKLNDNRVYTVEIKSTKVNERKISSSFSNGVIKYRNLVSEIKKDDFLYYPHYIRSSQSISNFSDYCNYVLKNVSEFQTVQTEMFIEKLMNIEKANANDILIRVYILNESNESKTIVVGYMLKEDLFMQRQIKHFYQAGKSELPIYYYSSLRNGKSCNLLFCDERLWG